MHLLTSVAHHSYTVSIYKIILSNECSDALNYPLAIPGYVTQLHPGTLQ